MSGDLRQVELLGERVVVRRVAPNDEAAYRAAVVRSAARIGEWNPVEPDAVPSMVAGQGSWWWSFLVFDRVSGELAAKVNLANIVPGRFRSGSLGYDAYDPYAGTGRLAEALGLIIDFAFAPLPTGLGLHRVEAVVQPGNVASAGLLRRLGFQHEGRTPRMLWLGRPGQEAWRDHDRYAVTVETWPAAPYAPPPLPRRVVLVNGLPGSGKTTFATRLAAEIGLPLLAKDHIKEGLAAQLPRERWGELDLGVLAAELLWDLLAAQPLGAVVESFWWDRRDRAFVEAGLRKAGLGKAGLGKAGPSEPGLGPAAAAPAAVSPSTRAPDSPGQAAVPATPEVWCRVPWEVAYERFVSRAGTPARHPVHETAARPELLDRAWWERELASAGPIGLGPVIDVQTGEGSSDRDVVRVALELGALWHRGDLPH